MKRKIQMLISGTLVIAGLIIIYQQRFNLWYLTGEMKDVISMFIALAFLGTGIITFIQNEENLIKFKEESKHD